ncbi:hypothetical protein HK102_005858 [Quaeritorhiza haematococci]|nr:hypothetical protein HK102_005858 [Quaeritorhiza haematococci]
MVDLDLPNELWSKMLRLIAFVFENFPAHTFPAVLHILATTIHPKPPQLPPELVRLISEYCDNNDALALRGVCRGWHGAVVKRVYIKADTILLQVCDRGSDCVDTLEFGWGVNFRFFELGKFSHLRKLVLNGIEFFHDFTPLLKVRLPNLKELAVNTDDGEYYWNEDWNEDCVLEATRAEARSFFSSLSSVDFGSTFWSYGGGLILHDVVHPDLLKINFGLMATLDGLTAFDSLAVIEMNEPLQPDTFIRTLADRCTGLRAFRWYTCNLVDPESVEYFVQQRGSQLVALEMDLDVNDEHPIDYYDRVDIVRYCTALELMQVMSIPAGAASFVFVSLKYVRDLHVDGVLMDKVKHFIGTILPSRCPNLQVLGISLQPDFAAGWDAGELQGWCKSRFPKLRVSNWCQTTPGRATNPFSCTMRRGITTSTTPDI